MQKLFLALCVCAMGCRPKVDSHVCVNLSGTTTTSDGGEGGSGGTGGSTGGTGSAGTGGAIGGTGGVPISCPAEQTFPQNEFCFSPSAECCDLQGADLDKYCFVVSGGTMQTPVSCTVVPPLPSSVETDNRNCMLIATPAPLECQWGPSQLLCCGP